MADTEAILKGFKNEVGALTERLITAEAESDSYRSLYEIYSKDYLAAARERDALKASLEAEKKAAADKLEVATQYAEELLGKIARLTKWVEEQGANADLIMSGRYEEKVWVKEDGEV